MKKYLFAAIGALVCLASQAKATLGFPGEECASVGIYIKDLRTGEVVAHNDSSRAMLPASVMKAVTAATVFSTSDSNFRFQTKVLLTGDVSGDGVCSGNLVIKASTDPTIDSELFENTQRAFASEILDALKQEGITCIKGQIIIKESLSDAGCIPQWEIDDVAWAYGAGLYGFNFNDNVFKLWPATGKSSPHVPSLNLSVKYAESTDLVRGINSDNLDAYGPRPTNAKWMVRSTMNSPAEVFKYKLADLLKANNIAVENNEVGTLQGEKLIFTHFSPYLSEILNQMLIESHNLYAEAMLRFVAPGESRKKAIEKEMKIWRDRNVRTAYNKILDGSGLSRADRIQPVFIADVLEWMAKSDYAFKYASLFPRVGETGTVKSLLKETPLKGKLALKSGSMNAVCCYAGYKIDNDGEPTHVIVVMVNGFYCDRGVLKSAIEKFLVNTL